MAALDISRKSSSSQKLLSQAELLKKKEMASSYSPMTVHVQLSSTESSMQYQVMYT